jgi:hypothetical protein
MKYLVATFVMVMTWMTAFAENECRIFKCGSIESVSTDNQTCVNVQQDTTKSHIVESCNDASTECGAIAWSNPTQANINKTCLTIVDPQFTNYTRIAGETCYNSTQCFNSNAATNSSVCTIASNENMGYCTASVPINGACASGNHEYCDVGAYCLSSNNTCQVARVVGETCDQSTLCRFGLICLASNDALNLFTCNSPGNLTNNMNFTATYIEDTDEFYGVNSACIGHTVNDTTNDEVKICRMGDLSLDQGKEALRRTGTDQLCNYTSFVGAGIGLNESRTGVDSAECGFNLDNSAWCHKRKGDTSFVEAYAKFIATDVSGYYCHVASNVEDCFAFLYGDGKDIYRTFSNALFEVNLVTGFARVANNDKCVAESITVSFWNGNSPDNAYNAGIAVISAISLAMIAF